VRISSVVEIIGGGTPDTKISDYWGGEIPWLSIADFNNNERFVEKTEKTITEKGLLNSSAKYLKAGDIIISARGTVGALSQVKVPMTFNQSCYGLRAKDGLTNDYLYYILQTQFNTLKDASYGAIFGAITTKTFDHINIPLPPMEVQEKIVAEIGGLEVQEREAIETIQILQDKIVDHANRLYKKYRLKELGQLCEQPVYGANEKAVDGNSQIDYRYIRITDINDDGSLNGNWKTARRVEDKYILKHGDFLFARSGATAGKTFLYSDTHGKAIYAGYLIKFSVLNHLLSSDFLNLALKSDFYKEWVLDMRKGSAQPNINAKQYSSFKIPLPSLSEQKKIVAKIQEIEAQISKLEEQISAIPQQKEAVLKKYLQ
jgi:restriction endonuclease S subunit